MLPFLKKLLSRYGEDEIANRAAALSYYTIFSIGPLLFVILGVVGVVVKSAGARAHLLSQLSSVIGPGATSTLSKTLSSQGLGSKTGLAFIVGGVGLVLGAIGIFGQLQKALSEILHVKPGPGAGRKPLIRQKVISLILVGVMCVLLLASIFLSAFISSLSHSAGRGAGFGILFFIIDFIVSLIIIGLMLALLYRTLPPVKIAWSVLIKAALVVSFLFAIGKIILGIIIGRNGTISAYGAAGSLIALLLWIFYSGQILYLGAAGIRVYLDDHPDQISPRYSGKNSVLKIERREKPFAKTFYKKTLNRFLLGFSRGWRA